METTEVINLQHPLLDLHLGLRAHNKTHKARTTTLEYNEAYHESGRGATLSFCIISIHGRLSYSDRAPSQFLVPDVSDTSHFVPGCTQWQGHRLGQACAPQPPTHLSCRSRVFEFLPPLPRSPRVWLWGRQPSHSCSCKNHHQI